MKKELKGLAPDLLGDAWDKAHEYVKNNPEKDLVVIPDIDMGFPMIVNKEYRDSLVRVWEETIPKNTGAPLTGKIIMFGTGGDMEKGNFNDLFTNPAKHSKPKSE